MWYWSATGGCSPRRASARICSRIEGLDWITALGAPAIQALVTSGAVQLSLFEQQEGAAMTDLGHRGQALNFPPCRWIMTTWDCQLGELSSGAVPGGGMRRSRPERLHWGRRDR